MKSKKYYEERVWVIMNMPYGAYAEKPRIKFLRIQDNKVYFLINGIETVFINHTF